MCIQCKTAEERIERHSKRTGYVAPVEKHGKYRSDKVNIKMLTDVRPGETVHILGRWLDPFCSHAVYRVRVIENRIVSPGTRRVFGVLPDFKDSPVTSLPFPATQMFRADHAVQTMQCSGSSERTVMSFENWCKHYNGLMNDTCRVGVVYKDVKCPSEEPLSYPCFKDRGCTDLCSQAAFRTPEEVAEEMEKARQSLQRYLENIANGICPHCKAAIREKRQVGRCVYAYPCWHRLYQGTLKQEERQWPQ